MINLIDLLICWTLTFHIVFIQSDIATRMCFKGKRTGTLHKIKMNVDPVRKVIEKIRRKQQGIWWKKMTFFTYQFQCAKKIKKFCLSLVNQ